MNQLQTLKVKLFGQESVIYGDTLILGGKNTIPKMQRLLLILLNAGKNGIAKHWLLENLYGGEELADSSNNLRVTFFRLKKVLLESGLPEYDYIVLRDGKYYWQCPMNMEVDTEKFKELLAQAEREKDSEKKVSLLKEACRLYTGEFLQKLSAEEWVLWESIEYKQKYFRSLETIFTHLLEKKEYEEALDLAELVCALYPLDEWQSVKIECYIGMNRFKEALQEYENTARLLVEELGVTPSEKMMRQFEIMSEHISNRPQVIGEIKDKLREKKMETGAFFCSLPSFRDAYRILRRAMERSGQSIYLLLCTLVGGNGHPMEEQVILVHLWNLPTENM